MRIAFLCKRRYMGKDVVVDRYARLYEFPYQLARLGHYVLGLCSDYYVSGDNSWHHGAPPGDLLWESHSIRGARALSMPLQPARVLNRVRAFVPDLVIGASDIPHAALAARISRQLRVPYTVDLYDNFEGFGQARIPGMVPLLRRAVRNAALVTTTSDQLAELVREEYRARGEVVSMPSTIDKSIFYVDDKLFCRSRLKLPAHAPMIGTAGGLRKDRGISVLCDAWKIASAITPDLRLVLAGPLGRGFIPPDDPHVHYLGELPHAQTAKLFNALDVGVVYLRDTAFGRYCFPQKAYEMLACGLPVVAANVGAMGDLLRGAPQSLYRADDAAHLAEQIEAQLAHPVRPNIPIDDWATVVGRLEPRLREIVSRTRHERIMM